MSDSTGHPPVEPPPPDPQDRWDTPIDADIACIRCSYNLRGLLPRGNCPECGTPIEDSLRGPLLRFAAPEYVQQIRMGLSFVLNGILLQILLWLAMVGATIALVSLNAPPSITGLTQLMMLIPAGMMIVGYWKYTAPDPGMIPHEQPHAARKVLRAAIIGNAVITLGSAAISLSSPYPNAPAPRVGAYATLLELLAFLFLLLDLACWVTQFLSVMKYTAWMARRLPDQELEKRAKRFMRLLPVVFVVGFVCVFLGPIIAMIAYWNLFHQVRRHVKRIVAEQATSAAG